MGTHACTHTHTRRPLTHAVACVHLCVSQEFKSAIVEYANQLTARLPKPTTSGACSSVCVLASVRAPPPLARVPTHALRAPAQAAPRRTSSPTTSSVTTPVSSSTPRPTAPTRCHRCGWQARESRSQARTHVRTRSRMHTQLESLIKAKIAPAFADHVNMDEQVEVFYDVIGSAIRVLVGCGCVPWHAHTHLRLTPRGARVLPPPSAAAGVGPVLFARPRVHQHDQDAVGQCGHRGRSVA